MTTFLADGHNPTTPADRTAESTRASGATADEHSAADARGLYCERCHTPLAVGMYPFCRNNPADHGVGTLTMQGDEMDWVQTNGCKTPIRFRSKSERRAWLKSQGLEECVRHVENPATGKSLHTTDWSKMTDPYTAANVRELMERAFKQRPTPPVNDSIHFRPFDDADIAELDKQYNSGH